MAGCVCNPVDGGERVVVSPHAEPVWSETPSPDEQRLMARGPTRGVMESVRWTERDGFTWRSDGKPVHAYVALLDLGSGMFWGQRWI